MADEDILSLRYVRLQQKLRKYKQLDASRIKQLNFLYNEVLKQDDVHNISIIFSNLLNCESIYYNKQEKDDTNIYKLVNKIVNDKSHINKTSENDKSQSKCPESVPNRYYSKNEIEVDHNALEREVQDTISMFRQLEDNVTRMFSHGHLTYPYMENLSLLIDNELLKKGLTFQSIDEFLLNNHDSRNDQKKQNNTISHNNVVEKWNNEDDDGFYKYLQLHWNPPDDINPSIELLQNLRSRHEEMLQRAAKVCDKFCPYDIVIRKKH